MNDVTYMNHGLERMSFIATVLVALMFPVMTVVGLL
jgi:hypothetical protein